MRPATARNSRLDRAAAGDEVPDQHDDADDQQQVNEAASDMKSEEAQRPQDEQNDGNRQEHFHSSLVGYGSVTTRGGACSLAWRGYTSLLCLSAAPMKPANSGCGSNGRLLSSGWNWT